MILLVLLATVQLSCGAIPMMRSLLEPQLITLDEVQSLVYDISEFDDPLVIEHQLSSIPFFTMLKNTKGQDHLKWDDVSEKTKIAESKKIIEEALSRLELAKAKLEKGNGNIYTEVEKVIQSLKFLERSSSQEMRQTLNSLQSIMTLAKPMMMMMPDLKELITTTEPDSYDKTEVLETPEITDSQTLSIRVISSDKPMFDEKPNAKDAYNSAEKSIEGEETAEEKPKASELSKETYETTKPPFEYRVKKKNFDGDDEFSSYKAKLTWKAAELVR